MVSHDDYRQENTKGIFILTLIVQLLANKNISENLLSK